MAGTLGYRVHLARYGWAQPFVYDGVMTGTAGIALRMEAIEITGLPPGIEYRAHVESYGWLDWMHEGVAGTTGQAKKLEALEFRNTGLPGVEVWGRVHAEGYGWMSVTQVVGGMLGSTGQNRQLEAIQLCLAQPAEKTGKAAEGLPSVGQVARTLLDSGLCLAGLGEMALKCIMSDFVDCMGVGDVLTAVSCTATVYDLGSMIPGQAEVAPGPGVSTIGPQNPAPPDWVPGGTTGLVARPGGSDHNGGNAGHGEGHGGAGGANPGGNNGNGGHGPVIVGPRGG